ncbi:MAG TPA: phage tail protein [Bryobacteraceae bacterium]|nr:phage tail protein [Bryobacteraceae bacterium]
MPTIFDLKEQTVTDTPLLLFQCVLPNGQAENWSTHRVTVAGVTYEARVLQHSQFEIQTASDQGVDGSPRISILLGNADSRFSQIERETGWKGSRLTVQFLFYDLRNNSSLTDPAVVFQGTCNSPDQITESTFRLTAMNRMNLQRLMLPPVRIERRCPWEFPATPQQQAEAIDGGLNGKYSRYYRCGYSAGQSGGTGSLNSGAPFTSCGYTREDCQARGMFTRFGGIEFVPAAIAVRSYGKDWQTSALSINEARYNDFVPMIYGTAWCTPPVVFARNDGNLTRMEVLLGMGEIQGVLTVLVNGVEIPLGQPGTNMTGTGWYNVPTLGTRDGGFDLNFVDASGQPAGDPYGSMCYLSVVAPTRLSSGNSLPSVKVLVQGLKLPVYAADGTYTGEQFTNNPAWVLLDLFRRSGWGISEIDIASFAAAAAYCDETINATDLNGNAIILARFQCNLVLQNRRSAGDVIRGVRNTARLYLTYGPTGLLQLQVENTAALGQPTKPEGSNSTEQWNGGWPSYEFGDGSNGFSGILRRASGEASLTVSTRSGADTPNRYSVEFQDALNGYQQDSYSMVDPDDIALTGQEISVTLPALGLPNFDQAGRILKFGLDKSIRGNTYIQFDTSIRAFGIRPGDLITVTYLKEGFNRQAFRVLKLSPATNYRTVTVTAQIHDDAWYADSNGQSTSPSGTLRPGGAGFGVPRPLIGTVLDSNEQIQFGVTEETATSSDGTVETSVIVSFTVPSSSAAGNSGIPLLSVAPTIGSEGTLAGEQVLYYGISAVDSAGQESAISFLVRASIVDNNSSVTLSDLSFASGTSAFNVYRGATPAQLFRIASNQPIASQFTDTGFTDQLVAPADINFDHANFYWRMELQPEIAATTQSVTTIGNNTLQMTDNQYRGMTVRITRGMGAGQERAITANSTTVLTVAPAWDVQPDATSWFVVAESGWRFGAQTKSSPVQFQILNHSGEVVQLTGRAANVNDVECSPELSTVTRWAIGGSGTADSNVPAAPTFGLSTGPAGTVVLSAISFSDLTNTKSISSATLTLHYWDELQGTPSLMLAGALGASDETLNLSSTGTAVPGSFVQIEAEVILVNQSLNNGLQYQVTRGMHGTAAMTHAAHATVYQLQNKTVVSPFPKEFFGSPYSGNWSLPVTMPDVRIASAELFVTNDKGNSDSVAISVTNTVNYGLRTLSGGQYSIQIDGYLAVEQSAAPVLVVEASHSVRDVFAVLVKAADAPVQLQLNVNGSVYCQLTFGAGALVSNTVNGMTLPPLTASAQVTLAVTSVGQTNPGADLTVLIRL